MGNKRILGSRDPLFPPCIENLVFFFLPCSCNTVLHPIHLSFFVIKLAKPPTFDVTTVLTDVCSPSKEKKNQFFFVLINISKIYLRKSIDSALVSPKIGSNIRNNGFDICCSR
jgi:hypothetical protein